jgi:hypothetical protein
VRQLPIVGVKDDYLEIAISDPKLILSVLNKRVANFLD